MISKPVEKLEKSTVFLLNAVITNILSLIFWPWHILYLGCSFLFREIKRLNDCKRSMSNLYDHAWPYSSMVYEDTSLTAFLLGCVPACPKHISWEPPFSTVHAFDAWPSNSHRTMKTTPYNDLRLCIFQFVSCSCPSPKMWKVKALPVGQTHVIQKVALLGSIFLGTKLAVASKLQFSLLLVLKKIWVYHNKPQHP